MRAARRIAALLVGCAAAAGAQAPNGLVGRWTGAVVRAGGVESLAVDIVPNGDSLAALLAFPDRPLAPPARVPVRAAGPGVWRFGTPYGAALVALDSAVQELVGTVGADSLATRVHLRRALPPATHDATREAVRVPSGRVTLPGTLFRPSGVARPAVAILVQGRGCGPVTGFEMQGEMLARHGVAALVYDKRGVDPAVRRCETATIAEFAEDVVAAARWLAARADVDSTRIGTVSRSAGGWVSAAASARARLAFLAMLVGPSTSVARQQIGSMEVVAHQLHLTPRDSADAVRYVEVSIGPGGRAARYTELRRLLDAGRRAGWAQAFLEPDDIAETEAGADSVWARRNAYDPADDLRRFQGPILAIYGGADEVVPFAENVALLRRLGSARVRTVVVPEAGHGLDQPEGTRSVRLGTGAELSYWKARRTPPIVHEELLAFLQREGMIGERHLTTPLPR
jgi:dienelactone hydrolase